MEYYNSLVTSVHENLGKVIASFISLEGEQALYVTHAIIILFVIFLLQLVIGIY